MLSVTCCLSSSSTVYFLTLCRSRGSFVQCCIGATRRSVSWSLLQRGSCSHHCKMKKKRLNFCINVGRVTSVENIIKHEALSWYHWKMLEQKRESIYLLLYTWICSGSNEMFGVYIGRKECHGVEWTSQCNQKMWMLMSE